MRPVLSFVLFSIGSAALAAACSSGKTGDRPASAPASPAVNASITVGAPITHGRLTVYPLYSSAAVADSEVLTLDEALKSGAVTIEEITDAEGNDNSDVNRLRVRNTSGKTVFVMAGEIVQGGKQDRVIAQDLTLAPGTTTVELPVFCVESGRWALADHREFNTPDVAAPPSVKNAAQNRGDQQLVWNQVATANNGAVFVGFGNVQLDSGRGGRAVSSRRPVARPESGPTTTESSPNRGEAVPTSPAPAAYAAALEINSDSSLLNAFAEDSVRTNVDPVVEEISKALGADARATGMAAFDGDKLVAVDLFHCRKIFMGLQPKLLRSYALQVLASTSESRPTTGAAPAKEDVCALVTRALAAPSTSEVKVGASRNGRFDVQDLCGLRSYANDGALVHFNILRR